MSVKDLNKEQLVQLKVDYLFQLSDEGTLSEILGRDSDNTLSTEDIVNADNIAPDDVVMRNYEGVNFVEEDFIC